ncbi:LLM class flavin-dependent oxidoreductase [Marinivivus vitaminiproducens]|uniref:LLM class flavin-dependent oxidoreductase n=1 Tax=Marinivivus vitaminiproducens TaxID=3035935 RepID=UPI0027A9DF01|nr:LLM class flavin-dependent oxidoreductase [Geminicoccaceae bacterium SCSIO 64248]
MMPLSVLDLSFVTDASGGPAALRGTLDLARAVDQLGYSRFWVAEHHNLPSVASGAPEVMIGQIAAVTRHLRVGAGGVMLPNHAPLMVAERFKVLEALHPGRIDLGIGRAPGTDGLTSMALRRRQTDNPADDFIDRFQELLYWKTGFPPDHPYRAIRVMPVETELPPIWLLGSSDYSARLAAQIGTGFAFAHHFASHDAEDAVRLYKEHFRPSILSPAPHAILATAAVCAETDAAAERLASTIDFNYVRRSQGDYRPLASPDEASAYVYAPAEERARLANRRRVFVGAPERVRRDLGGFAEAIGADEIMVTTAVYDQEAKLRSYTLLAEAFGLKRPDAIVTREPAACGL